MTLPTIAALPTPPARTDTPSLFNSRADAFLGALPSFQSQLNAWAAALPSEITGTDYAATSTTSLAIGTGSKALTIQTGKFFQIGQSVRIASTANPANFMDGQVTAHNNSTGALTVNVTAVGGSGTLAAWTVSLAVTSGIYLPLSGGSLSGSLSITGDLAATGSVSPKNLANWFLGSTGSNPVINFDAFDYIEFDRATNTKFFYIGGVEAFAVSGSNARFGGAVELRAASGTTAGRLGYASGVLSYGNGTTQLTIADTSSSQTFTNKTLTAPAINSGALDAASTVSDTGTIAANSVGFRGIPVSSNATGTFALTDNGKMVVATGNWTIPANGSVAFPNGAAILIVNNTAGAITVAITSDTLRQSGTSNTGTRTIAAYGEAVIKKVASTTWFISGNVT